MSATSVAAPIRSDLRNVAIVAHVDHGKTTLVDAMLRQSGAFSERAELVDRVMDSNDLEREKGITILAKNTAVRRMTEDGPVTINVVDTPGHADFGGEVERGLSMVDGVVLLVDASEGPLPQTRFVLRKTLAAKLPVILVVNKVDRPDARCAEVVDEVHDLLLDLASELDDGEGAVDMDAILDLPVIYASARAGRASLTAPADGELPEDEDMKAVFDTLLEHVPAPTGDTEAPLRALVTNLDASSFLGRIALCRIHAGTLRKGQTVGWCREDGTVEKVRLTELLITQNLDRVPAEQAAAGDLGAIAGDTGFLPTSSWNGRIRGDFLNMTAEICGNRFGRGLVCPGGVNWDLDPAACRGLLDRLRAGWRDVKGAVDVMFASPSVLDRLTGTGCVSLRTAEDFGMVGVAARACGLPRDARRHAPLSRLPLEDTDIRTAQGGDVLGRATVRRLEVADSVRLVEADLQHLARLGEEEKLREGESDTALWRAPMPDTLPGGMLAVAQVEGWRGELCHVAVTDAEGRFGVYKIYDPSWHNWSGLEMALRGEQISDFPLCNKSFNLSYCGHDL